MMVHLFVTNDCNLKCDYCYVSGLREKINFKIDDVDHFVNFISRTIMLNGSDTLTINFFGGEPLLNKPVIQEVIKQTKILDIQPDFMITTNGTLLNERNVDFMKEHNFIVSLSIDGTPEIHDEHRRFANGNGSWKYIEKNIEYLLDKIPYATARITYGANSVENLGTSIRFARSLGFQQIKAIPDFFDKKWDEKSFSLLEEQFKELNMLSRNEDLKLSMFNKKLKVQEDCSGGVTSFSINCDGNIYPCNYVVGQKEFCIGSINEWENYNLQYFPTDHSERVECHGCSYFKSCTSARCIFVNHRMTGTMCAPNGFFCAYERLETSYALNK